MVSFDSYLDKIERNLKQGDAGEHTHRSALENILAATVNGLTVINEPRRIQCGAPDLVVRKGLDTIGYVEAKDVGVSLDETERSEQLQRYLTLPNLILTDYLEFRWYVDGEKRKQARLGRARPNGKIDADPEGWAETAALLQAFLDKGPLKVGRAQDLASRMARLTHEIRKIVISVFEQGRASNTLMDLREAFARYLIPELNKETETPKFADMYAQTIAYGLFAARINHDQRKEPFTRYNAAREIPKTNPFLRQLFEIITGTALDEEPYLGYVEDLASLMNLADLDAVLEFFGQRTGRRDPVVHFYETFLAAYDKSLKTRRGVFYTPEAVVSYIVRSVDQLLKNRFGCPEGLADTERMDSGAHKVLILDPACGTGSFLYAVVDFIRERYIQSGNAGLWPGYVRTELLPRLFGFELMMAPYAVAHFKLGMQLAGMDLPELLRDRWVYDFEGRERLGVYLTNTLEDQGLIPEPGMFLGPYRFISEESTAAGAVKKSLPILVVTGNPPYAGHSANRSAFRNEHGKLVESFIGKLVKSYKEGLKEKNPKWLQDDYVKFIRWGQWRIEQTGAGILAFITNHGYLDNPTFRVMRKKLMQTFTHIYILDLHGNAKKKEKAPDGSTDKNVFDIMQGVAIGLFVKEPGKACPARIFHHDLWGDRQGKYEYLGRESLETTPWKELEPRKPGYYFVPLDYGLWEEYKAGFEITEIFPVHGVGMTTARDKMVIDFEKDPLIGLHFSGIPRRATRLSASG